MRNTLGSLALVAALALTLPAPADAISIDVQYLGGVDIAAFETRSWGEGSPLPTRRSSARFGWRSRV